MHCIFKITFPEKKQIENSVKVNFKFSETYYWNFEKLAETQCAHCVGLFPILPSYFQFKSADCPTMKSSTCPTLFYGVKLSELNKVSIVCFAN